MIEFTDAVKALPDEVTSDALVNAGPDALAAYQCATAAAQVITKVDAWLAGLANLPAYAGRDREPAFRVLNPATRAEFQALVNASGNNADPCLQRLNPLYVAAVREGIKFEMHTPIETAEIRQHIESAPTEKTRGVAWR